MRRGTSPERSCNATRGMIGRRGAGQHHGPRPPYLDGPAHPRELIGRHVGPWQRRPVGQGALDGERNAALGSVVANGFLDDAAGPVGQRYLDGAVLRQHVADNPPGADAVAGRGVAGRSLAGVISCRSGDRALSRSRSLTPARCSLGAVARKLRRVVLGELGQRPQQLLVAEQRLDALRQDVGEAIQRPTALAAFRRPSPRSGFRRSPDAPRRPPVPRRQRRRPGHRLCPCVRPVPALQLDGEALGARAAAKAASGRATVRLVAGVHVEGQADRRRAQLAKDRQGRPPGADAGNANGRQPAPGRGNVGS